MKKALGLFTLLSNANSYAVVLPYAGSNGTYNDFISVGYPYAYAPVPVNSLQVSQYFIKTDKMLLQTSMERSDEEHSNKQFFGNTLSSVESMEDVQISGEVSNE